MKQSIALNSMLSTKDKVSIQCIIHCRCYDRDNGAQHIAVRELLAQQSRVLRVSS
jgi:hypothetical protein